MFRYVPHGSEEKQKAFAVTHFSKYHHVADVQTTDLEDAFHLTNSIENHWSTNQGVKHHELSRSSSVGDVFQLGEKFYVVCSFGFAEIALDNKATA
jgi:hypothetical protein